MQWSEQVSRPIDIFICICIKAICQRILSQNSVYQFYYFLLFFFKHLYTVLVEILLDFRFRFLHNFVLRLQLILDQKSLCSGMRKFLARQSFLFLYVYTKARFYKSFNSTSIYYLMILFINCTVFFLLLLCIYYIMYIICQLKFF